MAIGKSPTRIVSEERFYVRGRPGLEAAVEDVARSAWRALTAMPGFGEWDVEVYLSFRSEIRRALIRHLKAVRVRRESRAPQGAGLGPTAFQRDWSPPAGQGLPAGRKGE